MTFKKGNSGYPDGRPKGKKLSTWILELGAMDEMPDEDTLPAFGRIARTHILAAQEAKGIRAAEWIANLTEKKPEEVHYHFPDTMRAESIAKLSLFDDPIPPADTVTHS